MRVGGRWTVPVGPVTVNNAWSMGLKVSVAASGLQSSSLTSASPVPSQEPLEGLLRPAGTV